MAWRWIGVAAAGALLAVSFAPSGASAQEDPDPRVGLGAGWLDAETAIRNLLDPWTGSPTPNADGRLDVEDL